MYQIYITVVKQPIEKQRAIFTYIYYAGTCEPAFNQE